MIGDPESSAENPQFYAPKNITLQGEFMVDFGFMPRAQLLIHAKALVLGPENNCLVPVMALFEIHCTGTILVVPNYRVRISSESREQRCNLLGRRLFRGAPVLPRFVLRGQKQL